MAGRIIPPELMPQIGVCLRQARTARALSLEQAAIKLEIPPDRLHRIEIGQEQITNLHAQLIITRYGGVRADRLDSLLMEWAMFEMNRENETKRRKHLSLVADDPRPWEKIKKDW